MTDRLASAQATLATLLATAGPDAELVAMVRGRIVAIATEKAAQEAALAVREAAEQAINSPLTQVCQFDSACRLPSAPSPPLAVSFPHPTRIQR